MKGQTSHRKGGNERRAPAGAKPAARAVRPRILVAEGEAHMREILELYLTVLGYRAHVVADVILALQAAGEERYDAFLCDLWLLDGETCELLRQLDQTGRRPVPAVSMSVSDVPKASALSQTAGFQRHLTKPFTPEQLESTLAQAARAEACKRASLPRTGA